MGVIPPADTVSRKHISVRVLRLLVLHYAPPPPPAGNSGSLTRVKATAAATAALPQSYKCMLGLFAFP